MNEFRIGDIVVCIEGGTNIPFSEGRYLTEGKQYEIQSLKYLNGRTYIFIINDRRAREIYDVKRFRNFQRERDNKLKELGL